MTLPEFFCWTRFGAEAGQSTADILERKEEERVSNNGVFFWGIGNALGPSMVELVRRHGSPEVVFSPIRSAPKRVDVFPAAVAAWVSGVTLDGDPYRLPGRSFVTSRQDPQKPRQAHYALVCRCDARLAESGSSERLPLVSLRNLRTGRPIGASQVTAIVHHDRKISGLPTYDVAMRARLVPPYLIRLRRAFTLPHTTNNRDLASAVEEAVKRSQPDRSEPEMISLPFWT